MRKTSASLFIVFSVMLCSAGLSMQHARAGQAGVGVINVPPKYGYIRVEEQADSIRVYLNISDYNSWADISNVSVTIDNYGTKVSTFLFEQYKSPDSYIEINSFSEQPAKNKLLMTEKCFFEKSNLKETVDERCDIAVRFVFRKTFFTGLHVVINDRSGSDAAQAYIAYNTEESTRSGDTIVIPWIDGRLTMKIPSFLLDVIAIAIGIAGVMYYLRYIKSGKQKQEKL
ncbi:MAG TPA: hypothetical protein VMT57_03865 [Candidatus Thermoplasmatota archaeon]|nr:hypothetical protein [Candidatus Thermoplasmatota archaeon]